MTPTPVLIAFCVCLAVCMTAGLPVFVALAAGYVLFFAYGISQHLSAIELLRGSAKGIRSVAGILIAFLFIGMLTASWRASGTIPAIVTDCLHLVKPSVFPLAAFAMVSIMSLLTGTSFGTAATMGTICMALGQTLGCSPVIVGGAILGGCYVGDRNSPLSTASLLVSQVTHTNFPKNLGLMAKRAVVPVLISCAIYLLLGFLFPASSSATSVELPYAQLFNLSWITLLPALSVVVLALARADVRLNMAISTAIAVIIALALQKADALILAQQLILGYEAPLPEIAQTLSGGGLVSMLQPALIILISSTYAGLFEATHLLDSLKSALVGLSEKLGRETALAISALSICALCCNQTLSTIITHQLFCGQYPNDEQSLALDIEDTTIVMCGMVPWCIACSVPLTVVGAPMVSILAAFYLFLQPICTIVRSRFS